MSCTGRKEAEGEELLPCEAASLMKQKELGEGLDLDINSKSAGRIFLFHRGGTFTPALCTHVHGDSSSEKTSR